MKMIFLEIKMALAILISAFTKFNENGHLYVRERRFKHAKIERCVHCKLKRSKYFPKQKNWQYGELHIGLFDNETKCPNAD